MSIRIVVCIDVDATSPVDAYVQVYRGMTRSGFDWWESSDEWFDTSGNLLTEAEAQGARMQGYALMQAQPIVPKGLFSD